MNKLTFRSMGSALAGVVASIAAGVAAAAPVAAIDVTDVTTGLSNQSTPITAIGTASLGLAVLLVAFLWVRKAMGR